MRQQKRVLLVDDDRFILESLSKDLLGEGYAVSIAQSSEEALEQLLRGPYDLVLTDLVMEPVDGLQLLRITKESYPDVVVMILTGYGDLHSAVEALRLGADDYLVKPCEPDELHFRVRTCLERSELRRSNSELERRVAERTTGLVEANARLRTEVTEHESARIALQRSLEEKELLLRELQHRVKNNLATIAGLINLQSMLSAGGPATGALSSLQKRVRAIYLIYEKLYRSTNLTMIDYRDYVEALAGGIVHGLPEPPLGIELALDVDAVALDLDAAVPLGLILTELIANAFQHAFPRGRGGSIRVRFGMSGALYELVVSDDGVGTPDRPAEGDADRLGLRLVASLAEQLNGEMSIASSGGTTVTVRFPLDAVRTESGITRPSEPRS